MNSSTLSRLKWEIAVGGILIVATAFYRNELIDSLRIKLPFINEHLNPETQSRVQDENKRQEAGIPRARASYPYYKWEPRPLDKIKYVMSWKPRKITLQPVGYVDGVRDSGIDPPKAGQITVLLINDTDETLGVPSQDGDIYLMLEVKMAGKWQRAQYHGDSWCGNSYGTRTLPPHSYAPILGYQPTVGKVATTRFVINNGAQDTLMSAEFEGTYSLDDVALSAYDGLSLRTAELQKLRTFLLREEVPALLPGNVSLSELRHSAWRALLSGRHDRNAALDVAKDVIALDPTLERRNASLETLMGQWQVALDQESKKKRLVHGFTSSNSLTPSHAK